jgi:prepilin peptidase CpaA
MMEIIHSVATIPLLITLSAGVVAAVTDVRSFQIPNVVTFPLLGAAILFHTMASVGGGIGFALLGGAVGFACLILFYVLGAVGAGDVKLLTAVGAWIGPGGAFVLFLVAAVLMGLYATGLTWWQGTLQQNLVKATFILRQGMTIVKHLGEEERVEQVVRTDDRRRRLIPFAVMVLGGIALLAAVKFIGR